MELTMPKGLQRIIGFVILFATVGLLSCQALINVSWAVKL